MPSASPVSSQVDPPKKRHSTILAYPSLSSASSLQRLVHGQNVVIALRRKQPVVQLHPDGAAAALLRPLCQGMVHQDVTHRDGPDGEEVAAVLPVGPRLVDQLEVGFVYQSRGLQGVDGGLVRSKFLAMRRNSP